MHIIYYNAPSFVTFLTIGVKEESFVFKKFRCFVITKKNIIVCACVFLALAVGISLFTLFLPSVAIAGEIPIYSVGTDEKVIAITFDCAWEDFDTQKILDVLKEHDAKATFFVTGDYVRRCPNSVKAFFDAGHDIGNHSDNHPHPNSLSERALVSDTEKCSEEIKKLGIEEKKLYRAPYGEYNDKTVKTINNMGYHFIQWDADSLDYTGLAVSDITERVVSRVGPGSIVLFHTGVENTAEALRQVLLKLKGEDYRFVTVDEIILKKDFWVDHTGRQIKNKLK